MKKLILKVICIVAVFTVIGAVVTKIDKLFQPADESSFVVKQIPADDVKANILITRDFSAANNLPVMEKEANSPQRFQFQITSPDKTLTVKTFRFEANDKKTKEAKKKVFVIKKSVDNTGVNRTTVQ